MIPLCVCHAFYNERSTKNYTSQKPLRSSSLDVHDNSFRPFFKALLVTLRPMGSSPSPFSDLEANGVQSQGPSSDLETDGVQSQGPFSDLEANGVQSQGPFSDLEADGVQF